MLDHFRTYYADIINMLQLFYCRYYHRKALMNLRNKKKIRCVFFATFEETWKYDGVYRLMEKSTRFEPIVLICPIVNYGYDNMVKRMIQCYRFFEKKGYKVYPAYNTENKTYVDVHVELKPDIIFYTNPYKGLIDNRYYITNFKEILTVYVPYFFNDTADNELAYNEFLHNVVWRRYLETDIHKSMATDYSRNHGRNVVVTGYPGIECFIYNQTICKGTDWKVKDNKLKRIIWAPHHSVLDSDTYKYASFMLYYDTMIELARKYQDKVQFAFKPHPVLRNKLNEIWGQKKTDRYYEEWPSRPDGGVVEGDDVDLFLSSDAMIHDSGSFIAEYLYLNKPVLRTLNGIDLNTLHNKFGLSCLDYHYMARNADDIESFIQDVISGGDSMKEKRTKFISEVLMPKGSPSQNIVNDILDSIDNQILYRI